MPDDVVISCYGSAGDVLPLIPVAAALKATSLRVTWMVNFECAPLLRLAGERVAVFKPLPTAGFASDPLVMTTRFHGWASWRRALDRYVAPTFVDDLTVACRWLERVRPLFVIAVGVNPIIRAACVRADVECISLSFSPQHAFMGDRGRSLARLTRARVGEALNLADESDVTRILWGGLPTAVLIDPVFVNTLEGPPEASITGYPYFDGCYANDLEATQARRYVGSSRRPVIACSLGSIASTNSEQVVSDVVAATAANSCNLLLMTPFPLTSSLGEHVVTAPLLPLSGLDIGLRAVIHHGGLGTSIGVSRLGIPSVVVPRAFDQPYNAAALERLGVATVATPQQPITDALGDLLSSPSYSSHARVLRDRIVAPDEAVRRILQLLPISGPAETTSV